ncbi:hypothetical protein D9757_010869 [Collybiopsis confluens]|uniref:Uncharacterized protein n=1 Tax=Collybiopsis confluens TaxID=2823264 RepID=A0A8H5H836_9AGAR|nr:hypothetical protein D9757_010869 [Collybiopsis confluens]
MQRSNARSTSCLLRHHQSTTFSLSSLQPFLPSSSILSTAPPGAPFPSAASKQRSPMSSMIPEIMIPPLDVLPFRSNVYEK